MKKCSTYCDTSASFHFRGPCPAGPVEASWDKNNTHLGKLPLKLLEAGLAFAEASIFNAANMTTLALGRGQSAKEKSVARLLKYYKLMANVDTDTPIPSEYRTETTFCQWIKELNFSHGRRCRDLVLYKDEDEQVIHIING